MTVVLVAILPLANLLNAFFDRVFHPEGYHIDTIISRLNRTIIKNHDTSRLLMSSASLINKALNTRFVSFVVLRHPQHILVAGSPRRAFTEREAAEAAKLAESSKTQVVFVDSLPEDTPALHTLRYHHIAMLVQIKYQSDVYTDDAVGYMMISHKLKNRGFVQRDVDLLIATSGLIALAIENANYYQQVRSFNENLRQEIAVATSRLRHSNYKLRKLDDAKDEFLSMASHQLRTPLTSIKGYLSMVLEGDAGRIGAVQRHFLSEAFSSSNNMVRIIDDLLSVSRIQTGKFALDKSDIDMAELVQEESGLMVDNAVAHGLKMALNIGNGDYHTSADSLKLRQIVDNLIDNAVHYSSQGGLINISLSRDGNRIVFKVIDNGIGVPKSELPNLFTKFQRASNARKRRPDGTGIGLFLVKRVAKEHGGDAFVQSEEDKGSTFGFWIPR
jgi:signal transduction histidine kinase